MLGTTVAVAIVKRMRLAQENGRRIAGPFAEWHVSYIIFAHMETDWKFLLAA